MLSMTAMLNRLTGFDDAYGSTDRTMGQGNSSSIPKRQIPSGAVSYTHLTLPTTPYV